MFSTFSAGDNTPSPQPRSPIQGSDIDPSTDDNPGQDLIGPKVEEGGGAVGPCDDDGDDPCRSEGIVTFVIREFSKMNEQILSEATYIRNLPWLVVYVIRLPYSGKV